MPITKMPVTERALFQRVNRHLLKVRRKLCTARDGTDQHENAATGRYYVVDTKKNEIAATHIDLEVYARELSVMREWEEVAL